MKHFLLFSFCLFINLQNAAAIEPVYSTTLANDSNSWDGSKFSYPDGNAKIVIQKITITPESDRLILPTHCHPIPLAAYVLSGSVHVVEPSGKYHIFSAGDAFVEVMNTWHKGEFKEKTELIAFYASSEGMPLAVKNDNSSDLAKNCK